VSRTFQPHDTVISVGHLRHRQPPARHHGRPVLGRGGGAGVHHRRRGRPRRRHGDARRGVQARTSPYSFQAWARRDSSCLRRAADANGLAVVSEVMDTQQVTLVARYGRHPAGGGAQHAELLAAARGRPCRKAGAAQARARRHHRGMADERRAHRVGRATARSSCGERGIRTFETYTRNTLDLNAIPVVKELSHLPVIVDPSHGTGIRNKVAAMARASIAAGADGLIIEVHHDPDHALSDGAQSLYPEQFDSWWGRSGPSPRSSGGGSRRRVPPGAQPRTFLTPPRPSGLMLGLAGD